MLMKEKDERKARQKRNKDMRKLYDERMRRKRKQYEILKARQEKRESALQDNKYLSENSSCNQSDVDDSFDNGNLVTKTG